MAESDDQRWLDTLAGRPTGTPSPDTREAEALRAAILATRGQHETADHDVEGGVQKLLFRLRREGLAEAPKKKTWHSYGVFAIAAMLALAIGVVTLQSPMDDMPVYRGSGAQSLSAPDSEKLTATLIAELEALGIKPIVTRFGANITLNAEWPAKPDARHTAFLKRHGLKQPTSATLAIEVTPTPDPSRK